MSHLADLLSQFRAVFLGIFLQAVPFLMLGTLASGMVEVFFERDELARLLPRRPWMAALTGGLLGVCVPVGECGAVPLTRRLFQKGVPTATCIAFLLAAPVVNPVVIASTYAVFGLSAVFWGRIALTLGIACLTAIIFSLQEDLGQILLDPPEPLPVAAMAKIAAPAAQPAPPPRIQRMVVIAVDEFFEMGRYLVIGALLAALLQTLIPQQAIAGLSRGPVLSVLIMAAIAVLLSVSSTVDAWIALAFVGPFSTGALLSFLVVGSMADMKSALMLTRVFRRRSVVYLVLLPLMLALVCTAVWAAWF